MSDKISSNRCVSDCSTNSAFPPGYPAVTTICGEATLGINSIGSSPMDKHPKRKITKLHTLVRTGLVMNRSDNDIELPSCQT